MGYLNRLARLLILTSVLLIPLQSAGALPDKVVLAEEFTSVF